MGKIKQFARNAYFAVLNAIDSMDYVFWHFFFSANIVIKAVVVAIALVALLFLAKVLLGFAATLAMKVVSVVATLVVKAVLFLLKITGNLFLFVFLPLSFFGFTKPFKAKYRGKKQGKSAKGKEE